MIPLEQQVCSLELAKKLKALGVKQESYFLWCEIKESGGSITSHVFACEHENAEDFAMVKGDEVVGVYSAFTVAELGEMLPRQCTQSRTEEEVRVHYAWGLSGYEENNFFAATEADARAKMLIHLLETGAIKFKN